MVPSESAIAVVATAILPIIVFASTPLFVARVGLNKGNMNDPWGGDHQSVNTGRLIPWQMLCEASLRRKHEGNAGVVG